MTTRLSQKHLLKGSREFELVDDAVNVKIDMPFLKKEFTVVLAILDPEPVTIKDTLAFVSAVNRESLIEIFVDKPNPEEFNAFVAAVRQRAIDEDYGKPKAGNINRNINVDHLQESLTMLQTYLTDDDITPFLQTMEALKDDPGSEQCFDDMFQAFNALGPRQGAVLTYAPYIVSMFSDDTDSD